MNRKDLDIIRKLAGDYRGIAERPVQDERRKLWSEHNSLITTRPLVLTNFGIFNYWCKKLFGDDALECSDPVLRAAEQWLKINLFRWEIGDDHIFEPWLPLYPRCKGLPIWGVDFKATASDTEGGAFHLDPVLKTPEDMKVLRKPELKIDEKDLAARYEILHGAVGDLLEIEACRGPYLSSFSLDISTTICRLLGMENLMLYMYDEPGFMHELLAFLRDGILSVLNQNDHDGDVSLTGSVNQAEPYSNELPPIRPGTRNRKLKDIWCFCAAQEYSLVSPEFHDEFLLQYQLPVIHKYGLSAYGCCEDLTEKIEMLKQVKNLRRISVTPFADLEKSAARIGRDYVISWRPNPTDMVCCGFEPDRISRIIRDGLEKSRGCHIDITLKDIETVENEPYRLKKFVEIVRREIDRFS